MTDNSLSLDLEHRQDDEFNSIASIYSDIFIDITPKGLVWGKKPNHHFQVKLKSDSTKENPEVAITLDIEFTATYPLSPPKVKLLEPVNLLKSHQAQLKSKYECLIKEYPKEEVCFTIISELMYLLDEIQAKTGKVLSLEEEREERLRQEREALQMREAKLAKEEEKATYRRNVELNEQIRQMKDDYLEEGIEFDNNNNNNNNNEQELGRSAPLPDDVQNYFLFEKDLADTLPVNGGRFKFRAISGFIKYNKTTFFSSIGKQYIVKPFVSSEVQAKADRMGLELSYLLTDIHLQEEYWFSESGKREIQDLERELQSCLHINDSHLLKLVGFQIDKLQGWRIRLLNEYSFVARTVSDVISSTKSESHVDWALARNWLIQIIPALEHLHNLGLTHKLINPLNVLLFEDENYTISEHSAAGPAGGFDATSKGYTKEVKLAHPLYGARLHKMKSKFVTTNINNNYNLSQLWMPPEVRGDNKTNDKGNEKDGNNNNNNNSSYSNKSDVWDLGILFARIMLGTNVFDQPQLTPENVSRIIPQCNALQNEKQNRYKDAVGDLLSRMLQFKPAKRPTPVELNALTFLRDGPAINLNRPALHTGLLSDMKLASISISSSASNTSRFFNNEPDANNSKRSLSSNKVDHTLTSRYARDFEEIGRLGKGGFGDVVKVRNKMEGTYYAIKKIKHKANKLDSILNEVLSLARLNHQYIVRYYGTWVEEAQDDSDATESSVTSQTTESNAIDQSSDTDDLHFGFGNNKLPPSLRLTRTDSFQVDFMSRSFDPKVDFDDQLSTEDDDSDSDSDDDDTDGDGDGAIDNYHVDEQSEDAFEFAQSTDDGELDLNTDKNEWSSSMEVLRETNKHKQQQRQRQRQKQKQSQHLQQVPAIRGGVVESTKQSILYIQMEFCENNTLLNLIEQGLPNNPTEYWRLFRQLLEAVSYIHKEGFIHRDLKPMNIFIDKSNNVKVGDFGLAKNSQSLLAASALRNLPLSGSNNNSATMTPTIYNDRGVIKAGDLSTIVGTVLYTAPEVASGSYDEKVDMFSLGVIFFEMCYSLSTGMERVTTLKRCRELIFPSTWKSTQEKKVVKALLNANPKARPSASALLQSGWLPVEHQDQVIKEALKSLADPASPWQQQVRETLFKQPYLLAKDILYDNNSFQEHESANDYLLFNKLLKDLADIFHTHGAVENLNINVVLPKTPLQPADQVYEVLDKSGSVVTLPFDLTIPVARFLSKNDVVIPKFYRHEFVYRSNLTKGLGGMPQKFSAMSFNIVTDTPEDIVFNDAECLKVVDEVLSLVSYIPTRRIILINHYDILDSVISFAFDNVKLNEGALASVLGTLSQLEIDKSAKEVRRILRDQVSVPHTVVEDLLENFNFTCPLHEARHKLQKLMIDSPHLYKLERAFAYITKILGVLNQFGVQSQVLINPLSNYDNSFYQHGIMFQGLFQADGFKRPNRIITGGRFDCLIQSFVDNSMAHYSDLKFKSTHGVGFTLTTSFLLKWTRSILSRRSSKSSVLSGGGNIGYNVGNNGSGIGSGGASGGVGNSSSGGGNGNINCAGGSRCDVIIASTDLENISKIGYELAGRLWTRKFSVDILPKAAPQDELIHQALDAGAQLIVLIRAGEIHKKSKKGSSYKPLRVKNLCTGKETNWDNYDDVVQHLHEEIHGDQFDEESSVNKQDDDFDDVGNLPEDQVTIDINQKVIVVNNEAPRGRKNKRDKWEVEGKGRSAGTKTVQSLANGPVLVFDIRDETLDMIGITSINQQEEWIRKVVYSTNNLPKSFALNIYNTLVKEAAKGSRWCILVASRTQHSTIVDLQR
ncbi:conserved hypothetical protein [Lodderomyces elongisporus NRRL YB-4239]|uniref:non-specific serine/threonine protein kinase n=1 Tax=Lodderomyces elongisporus (strain ATCC 11503 / CBS 2605 / JCM 1781 / NBRC 1676 / NRRL YB-4239) TaxID=379508 RepID=A5E786_LODEL|nr:conserved hypothetical protein [Lodderomyces elongisporus NRRL YB-4239]